MEWVRWGSLLCFLAVALGAFGAHALKGQLTPEAMQWYQTGGFYHLIHGVALVAVGWLAILKPSQALIRTAGWLFVCGILLFSGSLYALSLTGAKKLGMVTPFGGLALLAGWLCLAMAAG